jgi:hypothetical protein
MPPELVIRYPLWTRIYMVVLLPAFLILPITAIASDPEVASFAFALFFGAICLNLANWYLRPRLIADANGLHIRNPFATYEYMWSAVDSLELRKGGPGFNPFGKTMVATARDGSAVWINATWRVWPSQEARAFERQLISWLSWARTGSTQT